MKRKCCQLCHPMPMLLCLQQQNHECISASACQSFIVQADTPATHQQSVGRACWHLQTQLARSAVDLLQAMYDHKLNRHMHVVVFANLHDNDAWVIGICYSNGCYAIWQIGLIKRHLPFVALPFVCLCFLTAFLQFKHLRMS